MKFWMAMTTMQGFLSFVLAMFIVTIIWELLQPAYAQRQPRTMRWFAHGAIYAINLVLGREMFPLIASLMIISGLPEGSGLLAKTTLPAPMVWIISILALDFWQYLIHRLLHGVPWLWRCHRVHHSDQDFDLTTSFRFHPIEGILDALWRAPLVALLGIPWLGLLIYAVVMVIVNFFTHANVAINPAIDRVLRWTFVTPYMHRMHHAVHHGDSNTNFGTMFTMWDRLFRTYRAEATEGRMSFKVGLDTDKNHPPSNLWQMLWMPFR